MKITLNPDAEIVKVVKEGLEQTGGYCPCRLERTEENKCILQEKNIEKRKNIYN